MLQFKELWLRKEEWEGAWLRILGGEVVLPSWKVSCVVQGHYQNDVGRGQCCSRRDVHRGIGTGAVQEQGVPAADRHTR